MNRSESDPAELWSRCAARRGAARTWSLFREGWSALPEGSLKRWALMVVVGLMICLALVSGMAMVGPVLAERGMQEWDRRVLLAIAEGPMSVQAAILFESPGNFLSMIPVTIVAAVVAARCRRAILAMTFVAGYVLARPVFLLGFAMWDRARPRLILDGLAAPPFDSFPSGHVVQAVATYGLLAYAWGARSGSIVERAIIVALLVAWIAIIGIARIRLGAHWPSDVIAGAVIGVAWLVVLILAVRRAEQGVARAERE